MMVLQHMFYQTEYRGMEAKWTLTSPGYACIDYDSVIAFDLQKEEIKVVS